MCAHMVPVTSFPLGGSYSRVLTDSVVLAVALLLGPSYR